MIRHGRPASTWGGTDDDPGLDEIGRDQAAGAARTVGELAPALRPVRVVSSPLRRCRETAAPLAAFLGLDLEIDPAVGEIPTPSGLAPEERGPWLRTALAGRWADITGDIDYDQWRRKVHAAVLASPRTAVFSHFVAINGVLSIIAGDEQVVGFRPDHASITSLEIAQGQLRLLARGNDASTGVL